MIVVNERFRIEKYSHGYQLIESLPSLNPKAAEGTLKDHTTWPGTFSQCCNAIIEKSIGDEGPELQELKSIVGRINEVRAEVFAACTDGGRV